MIYVSVVRNMLLGKDLRYKGHTLECWYDSITPSPIVYRTNKIKCIVADGERLVVGDGPHQRPHSFYTIKVNKIGAL